MGLFAIAAEGGVHSRVGAVCELLAWSYTGAVSGDRAAWCLSKKIGTATIYLHVAWATVVKPKIYHGEYDIKVINDGHYKKEHANDTWDMRYLCGGFLKNNDVLRTWLRNHEDLLRERPRHLNLE